MCVCVFSQSTLYDTNEEREINYLLPTCDSMALNALNTMPLESYGLLSCGRCLFKIKYIAVSSHLGLMSIPHQFQTHLTESLRHSKNPPGPCSGVNIQ